MPAEKIQGYIGMGPEQGIHVKGEDAYRYALERSFSGTQEEVKEFREMLVKWFYSGNWVEEE